MQIIRDHCFEYVGQQSEIKSAQQMYIPAVVCLPVYSKYKTHTSLHICVYVCVLGHKNSSYATVNSAGMDNIIFHPYTHILHPNNDWQVGIFSLWIFNVHRLDWGVNILIFGLIFGLSHWFWYNRPMNISWLLTGDQSPTSHINGQGCLLQNLFGIGFLLPVHSWSPTTCKDCDITSTHWTNLNFSPFPQLLEHW